MKKKKFLVIALIIGMLILFIPIFWRQGLLLDSIGIHLDNPFSKKVIVPSTYSKIDRNQNGTPDALDVVSAARVEVKNRTPYKSNYYKGGYPPNSEGVCTDVVWRGLKGATIDLKSLLDQDIKNNISLYPRTKGAPDPNIDFRRVPNQNVYFSRYCDILTTKLIPRDVTNLKEWQPGDIVVYLDDFQHVGIISDKRAKDGTPYLIHNTQPFAAEIKLTSIKSPIHGHYRWKY